MRLIAIFIAILATAGVAAEETAPEPKVKQTADASNAFAVRLYGALDGATGNLFFSPYCISTSLAMTREGARGETRKQMDRVFAWNEGSRASHHRDLARALMPGTVQDGWGDQAKELPAYDLRVANAMWAQDGLRIRERFATTLDGHFTAPIRRIDFRDPKMARAAINSWVAERTQDRIKDIVPIGSPSSDTVLALSSAIWFKAAWKDRLDARWTEAAPFALTAGRTAPVAMMRRTAEYRYAADDAVQVLELPFLGASTALVVILPAKRAGLAMVEAALTAKKVDRWLASLRPSHVSVTFPKIELSCSTDVAKVLPAMGMPNAFDVKLADLGGITETRPLYVGAVLHKAYLKVDEAGTEAAAAAAQVFKSDDGDPIRFTADHPFLFLIRHQATGTILFMGRFAGPESRGAAVAGSPGIRSVR